MSIRYLTYIKEWWSDPYRKRPNWSERVAVVLTAVIALVGFLQWSVYRQQRRIMDMSERPWLSVPVVKIENVNTSDPKHPRLTLSFVVENTGNSIATLETLHAIMWPDPDANNGAKPYGQNTANFSEKPIDSKSACRNQPDDSKQTPWGILQKTQKPFEVPQDYSFEIEYPSRPIDLRITGCLFYTDHLGSGRHFTPFMAGFANKKPDGTCPEMNTRDPGEYWVTYSNHLKKDQLCIRYVEIGPIDGITP